MTRSATDLRSATNVKMKLSVVCLDSLATAVAMVACGSDSTTPTAPSASTGLVGSPLGALAVDPGLPPGSVTVKATVPAPLSPPDGDDVGAGSVVLTVTDPAPVYNEPWAFDVRFEIFENANPTTPTHSAAVPQGNGTTSYSVPAGVLQPDTYYVWRARAESEGEGGPWSNIFGFTVVPLIIDPPIPLDPIGGIVATSLRPLFTVRNGAVTGEVETVLIEVVVALDELFTDVITVSRTTARSRGETNIPISQNLEPETTHFWRARGTNEDLPFTVVPPLDDGPASPLPIHGGVDVSSEWSSTETFVTPDASAAGTFNGAGSSPNAPFTTPGGSPPNLHFVVNAVAMAHPGALANSCQLDGGSWEFMDRVVEALRAIDDRWGYNCKRGNCNDLSLDVVDYYRGSAQTTAAANGSSDVAIFDIIVNHCNQFNPTPGWLDLTHETEEGGSIGRFKYPR